METFYLVDFENVGGIGFAGCEKLDESSHVIIFFTANARKIDMCDIANHGTASLEMIEVPAGKQSTDIHISSYVGFLVGSHPTGKIRIFVISNDTDFDNVLAFWWGEHGIKTYRSETISGPSIKLEPTVAPVAASSNEALSSSSKAPTVSAGKKMSINNKVMSTLRKAGFPSDVAGYAASTVSKFLSVKNGKQSTYRAIISKYGQQRGLEIYRCIKGIL